MKTSEAQTVITAINATEAEKNFYRYFSKKKFLLLRISALPIADNYKKNLDEK
jgi:hypothetical protein